jgi:predicted anti-sigma-YlaC factor YlaD
MNTNGRSEGSACREFEALLEDSLAGQLGGAEGERLSAHLSGCAACRQVLEEVCLGGQLVRLARQPAEDPGAGFTTRVMAAIQDEEARRSVAWNFWRPIEVLSLRLSMAATLALALLCGYGVMHSRFSTPAEVEMAGQPEVRELFPEPMHQQTTHDEVLMSIADKSHGK